MFAYVILHYNSIEDTIRCVNSIINFNDVGTYKIIIVDNKSTDNSGIELMNYYQINEDVHLIQNNNNGGFSQGNNIGCEYAIKNYSPDFLCVFNNDTYINDPEFQNKVIKVYKDTPFHIYGPRIWNTERNYNQNPRKIVSNLKEAEEQLEKIRFNEKVLYSKVPYMYYFLSRKNQIRLSKNSVHGTAIIFSKKYYSMFEQVFLEKSFMYGEENYLYYRVQKYKLDIEINENITVYHNHGRSTSKSTVNLIEKWKFQSKYMIIALSNLIELYKQDESISIKRNSK